MRTIISAFSSESRSRFEDQRRQRDDDLDDEDGDERDARSRRRADDERSERGERVTIVMIAQDRGERQAKIAMNGQIAASVPDRGQPSGRGRASGPA